MLVIFVNSVQVRVLGPEEWRKMVAKMPQLSDEPVEPVSENTAFEELYRKIEVYPKPVVNVVGNGVWDWLRKHFILVGDWYKTNTDPCSSSTAEAGGTCPRAKPSLVKLRKRLRCARSPRKLAWKGCN